MEKYTVVHFIEENTVDAVPSAWITNDDCKWPLATNSKSLKTLKKEASAPGPDWLTYKIRVLGSYARQNAKLAEITSDLEGSLLKNNNQHEPERVEPPIDPVFQGGNGDPVGIIPFTLVQHASDELASLKAAFAEFQKISLENQEKLKIELRETKQLILQCLAQTNIQPAAATNFPLLPICDLEELKLVEEWLVEQQNKNLMVKALSRIGGSGPAKTIYNILAHVFSHELSKSLRLTNKSGKYEISNHKITRSVIDAALVSKGLNLTEKQVVTHIGVWFRSVEDRKGGRSRRKKTKAAVGSENGNSPQDENSQDPQGSRQSTD